MRRLVRDLNGTYRNKAALHARDCEGDGFEWLIADDRDNSVFAWLRKAPGEKLVAVITNFTPVYRESYTIRCPWRGDGGKSSTATPRSMAAAAKATEGAVQATKNSAGVITATITLPPLATLMLEQD